MSGFYAELDFEVEVEYTCVSKGYPEQGPTYSCGGQPAEPPEFEINRVMFNGKDILPFLTDDQIDYLKEQAADDYAEDQKCDLYTDDNDY